MKSYPALIRPLLFRLSPESAHHFTLQTLTAFGRSEALLRILFGPAPRWPVSSFGLRFRNPVGLAAGMDKNAVALAAWEAVGFGFIEIGTVTRHPQPGNPHPRLYRYPQQQALINRMGFNNDGAEAVAKRLSHQRKIGKWPKIPIGINLGKSKVTPNAEAAADYAESYRLLEEFGDYFVVNISSPNTPGLRDLHAVEALEEVIEAIKSVASTPKPVLVKISPDQQADDLVAVTKLAERKNLAGLIATNTTLDHAAIPSGADQQGGLSGYPLEHRSTEVLRAVRHETKLPIIGSGGIMSAEAARAKQRAGANLVQLYTGFVYRGPKLIREISRVWGRRK